MSALLHSYPLTHSPRRHLSVVPEPVADSSLVAVRSRPDATVYRRRRLYVATVAFLAVFTFWYAAQAVAGASTNPPNATASGAAGSSTSVTTWVVRPGDTLWSIATALTPEGHDLRPVLHRLQQRYGKTPLDVGMRVSL